MQSHVFSQLLKQGNVYACKCIISFFKEWTFVPHLHASSEEKRFHFLLLSFSTVLANVFDLFCSPKLQLFDIGMLDRSHHIELDLIFVYKRPLLTPVKKNLVVAGKVARSGLLPSHTAAVRDEGRRAPCESDALIHARWLACLDQEVESSLHVLLLPSK